MNYALSYVTSPDQTATLEDFVAAGVNDDMTYINFSSSPYFSTSDLFALKYSCSAL